MFYLLSKELSTSQNQTVIKPDRGEFFMKNWRPIVFLNIDIKLISIFLYLTNRNSLKN